MAEPEMNIPARDVKDKSMPELMSDLVGEFTDLVNEEMAMAKAELSEKIAAAALAAGLFSGSMLAGLMFLGTATALAIIALALVVPAWLAALIVTAAWGLIAGVLLLTGKRSAQSVTSSPFPEKTAQTLKEDAQWARQQTGSSSK